MLLTPLLLLASDRLRAPPPRRTAPIRGRPHRRQPRRAGDHRRLRPPTGRSSAACSMPAASRPPCWSTTPKAGRAIRRFGWKVYYGDATRLDLLRSAGAGTPRACSCWRSTTSSRAWRWRSWCASTSASDDRRAGLAQRLALLPAAQSRHRAVERETQLDSRADERPQRARAARPAAHRARTLALRFRPHNLELVEQMRPHTGRRGAADRHRQAGAASSLEEQFARERGKPAAPPLVLGAFPGPRPGIPAGTANLQIAFAIRCRPRSRPKPRPTRQTRQKDAVLRSLAEQRPFARRPRSSSWRAAEGADAEPLHRVPPAARCTRRRW